MKALIKKIARGLLGEYAAYYVFEHPATAAASAGAAFQVVRVDADAIRASDDELLRAQAFYAGEGALAYACLAEGRMVGLCFYWYGGRYLTRNFWPLKPDEAKLVQIVTTPAMRGKKVAGALIGASLADVAAQGFARAYARVWHSNTPSLRAFEGAGWKRIALVVEVNPLRARKPLRLRLPAR